MHGSPTEGVTGVTVTSPNDSVPEQLTRSDSPSRFSDLLLQAARRCQKTVDCSVVRIWIARRGGARLVGKEFREEQTPHEIRLARGEGIAGWVMLEEEPLRLIAMGKRPTFRGPAFTARTAIAVPMFRRGAAFGAIECLEPRSGQDFSDEDLDRLVTATESIAFAIDNAMLFDAAERRSLEREVLLEITRTLSAPLELEEVIEEILHALRQVVDYDAAAIYLLNHRTQALELKRQMGYPEGSEKSFDLEIGRGIVGWVAKTGEPLIVPDVGSDGRYVASRASTRSELAVPLVVEGRTIGVFNLESDLDDAYHDGHMELLRAFAAQAAAAVERARLTRELLERRRIEKELAIARDIQLSFLPKQAPEIPGFEVAGATRPHDQVGGDYYDFINVSESRLGLAIADVSGKGIPAALLMAGFRMSLLAEIRNEFAIRAVMRKVNSLVHESTDRDKFVTAFYGVLDTKNRVLIFSNAGHNPPILRRADGTLEHLVEGGVTLGVLPDARYDERPIALDKDDVLVMFTDGISEAESPSGEQFGTQRIEEIMTRLAAASAREILDGIVGETLAWSGSRGQIDDLTIVVLKVTK
jgi:serine phosphatase RsbU (regulator of sigma subunit)